MNSMDYNVLYPFMIFITNSSLRLKAVFHPSISLAVGEILRSRKIGFSLARFAKCKTEIKNFQLREQQDKFSGDELKKATLSFKFFASRERNTEVENGH